jgi:hypothetical protein
MLIYFPWKHQKSRVLSCHIFEFQKLNKIRQWVLAQKLSKTNSTHLWLYETPTEIQEAFTEIAKCKSIHKMFENHFGSDVDIDIIHQMNEVYVSAPLVPNNFQQTSDEVFYTRHIDGPFFYIPFASCYRMIIGMDNNTKITTVFNMVPEEHTIQTCDVVAFDFHRECHYIKKNTNSSINDYHVVMKVHYCIYPKWARICGKLLTLLSVCYNKIIRNLFLYNKCMTSIMIFTTKLVHDIEYYIGYNNISFTILLWYISRLTHHYVFLYGTAYIHYIRLLDSVNNNCYNQVFNRDYHFYKTLYMIQMLYWYIYYTYNNPNFLGAMMIAFSYFVYFMDVKVMSKYCEFYSLLGLLNSIEFNSKMYFYINSHIFFNFLELFSITDY